MLRLKCFVAFCAAHLLRVAVAGEDLSDFSNNLASDLGPLLALFGEPMTRQYLSESTTLLDYFIFAVCPIGIITAIVSAIRVCGHSSLRAFIGRSQEGNGVVEAELCTSTSRDVCELFNHGGITRVLGQPNVLELVCVYPKTTAAGGEECDKSLPELHIFQDYLEKSESDDDLSEWKKLRGSLITSSDSSCPSFAPKPNLSLNAGIKRQPAWVFVLVALTGVILQVGILVLAGFGAWKLDWNLYNPSNPSSKDYPPRMYIAGTALLCIGMCSCAALVGQATQEITFKRQTRGLEQRTRLMWLQPGPQVIGDQSVDPFAHWESPSKQLNYWVSSRKRRTGKTFETLTLLAVTFTLMGYVLQFIGLRGMRAWVSIAQLGATLLMSFLRGLLRMQRLGKDDNELEKMPDLVAGHELDWLAFEIARQKSPGSDRKTTRCVQPRISSFFKPWHCNAQNEVGKTSGLSMKSSQSEFWHATGTHIDAQGVKGAARNSEIASTHQEKHLLMSPGSACSLETSSHGCQMDSSFVFYIRRRLAFLTDHVSPTEILDIKDRKWDDSTVRVRHSAKMLATSIEEIAQFLFQKWDMRHGKRPEEITLKIKASGGLRALCYHEQEVRVALRYMAGSTWRVDSSSIEAILGLWTWSLLHDDRLIYEDESGNLCSTDQNWVEYEQIVSASSDEDSLDRVADARDELSLWLGSDCPSISSHLLETDQEHAVGNHDLWSTVPDDDKGVSHFKGSRLRRWGTKPSGKAMRNLRFFGWGSVDKPLLLKSHQDGSDPELRIMTVSQGLSHLRFCERELWSALVCSLWSFPGIAHGKAETALAELDGDIRLENRVLTGMSKIYVEYGLGTRSEALLSLVPALKNQIQPDHRGMLDELVKSLRGYRQNGEWDRAQLLVRWACRQFEKSQASQDKEIFECQGQKYASPMAYVLQQAGELYRWAFAIKGKEELRAFAISGINWMEQFRGMKEHDGQGLTGKDSDTMSLDGVQEVAEIIDRYKSVAEMVQKHTGHDTGEPLSPSTETHPLVQALKDRNRATSLFQLTRTEPGAFGSKALRSAFPLSARNNWTEIVESIIEMNGSIDSQDEEGRTAVSYCAENGHEFTLEFLIRRGAFLDQADRQGQTALHWAAQAGNMKCAQRLIQSGQTDLDRPDQQGNTALWNALSGGHLSVIEALLSAGADVASRRKDNQTPLTWAGQKGLLNIMNILFEHGAEIGQKGDRERTALHWAAAEGHASCLQLLAAKGGDLYEYDRNYLTPVILAAKMGHEECVDVLLRHGVDFKNYNQNGSRPLHCAAGRDELGVVSKLLQIGVDVNGLDKSRQSALFWAVSRSRDKVFQLLLDNGADVNLIDQYNKTCLHYAVENQPLWPYIIKKLLQYGINTDHATSSGETVMHIAASKGGWTAFEALMEHDGPIQIDLPDKWGSTPLMAAAKGGHIKIVEVLLDRGAGIDKHGAFGRTPLMLAVENRDIKVVELILDRGADVNQKDDSGWTALFHANRNYQGEIASLLIARGADKHTGPNEDWYTS